MVHSELLAIRDGALTHIAITTESSIDFNTQASPISAAALMEARLCKSIRSDEENTRIFRTALPSGSTMNRYHDIISDWVLDAINNFPNLIRLARPLAEAMICPRPCKPCESVPALYELVLISLRFSVPLRYGDL